MPKYAPDFWRNNYLDMSSAGGGDAVWQTMGATAKPAAEGQAAGSSAYDTCAGWGQSECASAPFFGTQPSRPFPLAFRQDGIPHKPEFLSPL